MNTTLALQAIALHSSATHITAADVANMLSTVKGTTFASITQVTEVALAAKHKAIADKHPAAKIMKVTEASVQLFANLATYTDVYTNAVKRTAAKIDGNDAAAVESFQKQDNWFEHTDCFSVVKHKTKEQFYLYAIYNNANSIYMQDGKEVTKEFVAQFMTPSAAKALFSDGTTHNVANDVTHSVIVRCTGLENIVSIVANKQLLLA